MTTTDVSQSLYRPHVLYNPLNYLKPEFHETPGRVAGNCPTDRVGTPDSREPVPKISYCCYLLQFGSVGEVVETSL